RLQRGLAADAQVVDVAVAEEQALVLAQPVPHLAVTRQRSVVVETKPLGGRALGLGVIADAAMAHQPRGLGGKAAASFAGAGLGVLAGAVHQGVPRSCDVATVTQPRETST